MKLAGYFGFIKWLAEQNWPKVVYLHPLDYCRLVAFFRPEQLSYKELEILDVIIRPKPPIDRPAELDVSKDQIWTE